MDEITKKFYGATIEVRLTEKTLKAMIDEARRKLDYQLAKIPPPPAKSGMVQALRLKSINPLRYELSLVSRTYDNESRTIL